jgi:hypothetical protein
VDAGLVELDQQLRQHLLEPCLGRRGEAGRKGTPLKASDKMAWPGRPRVRIHTRSTPAEVPRFMSGPLGSRPPLLTATETLVPGPFARRVTLLYQPYSAGDAASKVEQQMTVRLVVSLPPIQ